MKIGATKFRLALVALVLFVSYAYFNEAPGWNQESRIAVARAIVEKGTVRIDDYEQSTGDKSIFSGHYYSNKAPGQSLIALPAVLLTEAVFRVLGKDTSQPVVASAVRYVATVFAAGLPTVVAALCIAWMAIRTGASRSGAIIAALAFGLATPAFVYATLLFGNSLTAGCLAVAFAGAIALNKRDVSRSSSGLALLVGVAAGWAVVTEYPAAPAALMIAALAVVPGVIADRGIRGLQRVRQAAVIAAGGVTAGAILCIYNVMAFGSLFALSYEGQVGFEGMHQGFMGVNLPNLAVLWEILVGEYRGLLPLAPVIAVAPIGLWLLWRNGERAIAITAAAVSVYYLMFNAAFVYWDGGYSYGPRYIGAALPFMCVGLATWWTKGGAPARLVIALLAIWGVALAITTASTIPMPEGSSLASAQGGLRMLLDGRTQLESGYAYSKNLGELVGLHGQMSLVPLIFGWALAFATFGISTSAARHARSRASSWLMSLVA